MPDDPIDDFDKYVTRAAPVVSRGARTDRHNNPIAAAVGAGGKNQFTKALDDVGIPWEQGDPFPGNEGGASMRTIRIKGDPFEGARAILSRTNAIQGWYAHKTGKSVLPKYNVKTNQDFVRLPIERQNEIISGIYQAEGGQGKLKPAEDDFDKYVTQGSAPVVKPMTPAEKRVSDYTRARQVLSDPDKPVTQAIGEIQSGVRGVKSYDTELSAQEESQFQTWKQQYAPKDTGADYDLRGAFKAGLKPDPKTGHWPDTFKKPNHPTFSVESQYAVDEDRAKAGRWEGDQFIPPATQEPKPKTPKVTSTVKEADTGDEVQSQPKPLKFTPADQSESNVNRLAQGAQGLAEQVQMQNLQLPKNHPDLLGKHVEVKFDHQPTAEEIDSAYLERLGKGYGAIGQKFRDEMGIPLTSSGVAVEKLSDGSYVAHARPTQGFVDAVNAYATGGRKAYESAIGAQQIGKAAVAKDVNAELKRGEGVAQDLGQAGAREALKTAQFVQNAADLVRGRAPEDDPSALAISRAAQSIPQPTTWTGSAGEMGLGTAGAITRAEALGGAPGFPASQAVENLQRGPEAAYKAGILAAPIIAAGPIGEAVGANELSAAGRQTLLRGVGASSLAGSTAAGGGSARDIASSALTGGAFPVGAKGEADSRVPEVQGREALGINRAPVVPDIDAKLAAREASVKPSTQPEDVPAMRVRGSIASTVEPADLRPAPPGTAEAVQLGGARSRLRSLPQAEPLPTKAPPNTASSIELAANRVVGPTKPVQGVEEGAKLNRWQHRDFGLVTESADQSGAAKGKVRVIDQDGNEHLIQRPKGTGAGNQIAVPVRAKPIDARTADAQARAEENAPFKIIDRRGQKSAEASETVVTPAPAEVQPSAGVEQSAPPPIVPRKAETPRPIVLPQAKAKADVLPDLKPDAKLLTSPRVERPVALPDLKPRALPQTLARTGREADPSSYAPTANVPDYEAARKHIDTLGADEAEAQYRKFAQEGGRPTIDGREIPNQILGIALTDRYRAEGNIAAAVKLTNDVLVPRSTEIAQDLQAHAVVDRYTPTGTLIQATRIFKDYGREITSSEVAPALKISDRLAKLETDYGELRTKYNALLKTPTNGKPNGTWRTKVQPIQARLATMEAEAKARLAARAELAKSQTIGPKGQRGSGINPVDVAASIADWSVIGAAKMGRSGLSMTAWSADMISEFGESIRPHLDEIRNQAAKLLRDQRAQIKEDTLKARVTEGLPEDTPSTHVDQLVAEYKKQRDGLLKGRRELTKVVQDPSILREIGAHGKNPVEISGASKITRAGITRSQWNKEMQAEHGDASDATFRRSYQLLKDSRAALKELSVQGQAVKLAGKGANADQVKQVRTQMARAAAQRVQARNDLEKEFQRLEEKQQSVALRYVQSGLRDALLTLRGVPRILLGMTVRSAGMIPEGVADNIMDRAQAVGGRPLVTPQQSPRTIWAGITGLKDIPSAASKAFMFKPSKWMPRVHDGPTGNLLADLPVTAMSRYYAMKEASVRTYQLPKAKIEIARQFALNDVKDGLISRNRVWSRAQDYINGAVEFEGRNQSRLIDSLAESHAQYEIDNKAIQPSFKDNRIAELKENPNLMIDALAMQKADRSVYAQPFSRFSQGKARAIRQLMGTESGAGRAVGQTAMTIEMPFVRRPVNNVVDVLTGYTGLKIPLEVGKTVYRAGKAWKSGESKSLSEAINSALSTAQTKALIQSVSQAATTGVGLMALGYTLNKAGLMTSAKKPSSAQLKTMDAEGIAPGSLAWKGHSFQISRVPVAGWLMGIGSTYSQDGAVAIPGAFYDMAMDHPYMRAFAGTVRGIESWGRAMHGAKTMEDATKATILKLAEAGGSVLSRVVPAPLSIVAEALDTRQRTIKEGAKANALENLLGPTKMRLPLLRPTLPAKTTVLGDEIAKPAWSVIDPFGTRQVKDSPGLKEMIRLGVNIGEMKDATAGEKPKQVAPENMELFRKANPEAIELIDKLVNLPAYNALSEGEKRKVMKKYIGQVRKPYEKLRVPIN